MNFLSFSPSFDIRQYFPGVDLEPDFLGVSRTSKLENLGVRQKIWESAIFLKYDVTMMAVKKFTNYRLR